jgi:hypothetical protein
MSTLQSLKAASNLTDVASLLGFKPSFLSYVLYKQAATEKYKSFQIPKKFGGVRSITAPFAGMKLAQKRLADLLQDCAIEIGKVKGRKDWVSHGFKRERSIVTNANQYRHRRFVFNIDLKDFFPSINFGRVRGYLMKQNELALNEKVATVLAQIACFDNALPQGSPCSPIISNLIAHILDMHCVKLASQAGCTYSRYADDLTFSTNKKVFPAEIAVRSETDPDGWAPGDELSKLVKRSGFDINPAKTRMQYRDSRQEVTGLVVNKRINVRREYRHNVRAMVHQLLLSGSFTTLLPEKDVATGAVTMQEKAGTLNQLNGMLSFIGFVDLKNKERSKAQIQEQRRLSSTELLHRKFLLYRDFYAAPSPVIVCEGETDNIYLLHAIRSLAAQFPHLAGMSPEGKIALKIRLYKHSGSRTAKIIGLGDGGSGSLTRFINAFRDDAKGFKAPGHRHPVIILYDNDAGAQGLSKILKAGTPVSENGATKFIHLSQSLYALPTPPVNGKKDSKIEDFFEQATKMTIISGKTFRDGNNADNNQHYGKVVFAHKVIKPNAKTINFDGFIPLLNNIMAVLGHHYATNAGTEATAAAAASVN